MKKNIRLILLPALVLLFSVMTSCGGSFSSLMTAKPTEGVGLGFEGITWNIANTNLFIPNPLIWYRGLPVKDFLEIGGRISLLSAGADIKIIPLYLDMIALAADVEVAYPYYYAGLNAFSCDLTGSLLVTFQPIQFISFTVAPKFRYAMLAIPMYGGSAVVSLFNTPEFALVFDVSLMAFMTTKPATASTNLSSALNNLYNSQSMWSIGVGLQF